MTETGGQSGEGFLSEEARLAEHRKLYAAANREESKIMLSRDADARTLDKYLEATVIFNKWLAHNPGLAESRDAADKASEAEYYNEKTLKYRKILDGSYYKEKALFCREKADDLKRLAGERTDDYGNAGRKQAAAWLRMEASCLEMPTPRPPAPGQQENTR